METSLKSGLGVVVYDILDNDSMSEGDKVSHIIEAFEKARSQISQLQATNQAHEGAAPATESVKDGAAESKTDEPLDTSTTTTVELRDK